MDNSEKRLNYVFFYGLYMDPEILKSVNVEARNPRKAVANGYRLRIGNKATLLRDENGKTHGIVYELTHDEINRLYWGAGLDSYVAEALSVDTDIGERLSVLCCNLLTSPESGESNPEYTERLFLCMKRLGVPAPATW